MASNDDLFAKIRIQPRGSKKKQEEERKAKECAWEGCEKPGTHKAPMGRNREGQYVNFCLEHVREYNKNFNYFQGLSDEQVSAFQKESQATGNRPTWRMSARKPGEPVDQASIRGTPGWHRRVNSRLSADGRRVPTGDGAQQRKLKRLEEKSLRDLGLKAGATKEDINRAYKRLLRQNHPDMNGGDRSTEGRLQQVIAAHKVLKKAGLC